MPVIDSPDFAAWHQPRLLDYLRGRIRLKHYSIRTEDAYVDWMRRLPGSRHVGAKEVEAFLAHLAVEGKVAVSTQSKAKTALLFVSREVLASRLPWLNAVESATRTQVCPSS